MDRKSHLGPNLARFWRPKAPLRPAQEGPERHQKRSQNAIKILIVFLIDFGSEKGAQRDEFGGPKCVQNRIKNEHENEDEKQTLLGAS